MNVQKIRGIGGAVYEEDLQLSTQWRSRMRAIEKAARASAARNSHVAVSTGEPASQGADAVVLWNEANNQRYTYSHSTAAMAYCDSAQFVLR